jgi:hypothetical protein
MFKFWFYDRLGLFLKQYPSEAFEKMAANDLVDIAEVRNHFQKKGL